MKNFNFKKFSFFIIFVSLINLSNVKSDEFWSNKVDGPTTKDQAIKLLEGKSLDPIEGIWYDAESTVDMRQTSAIYKVEEGLYSRWIIINSVPRLVGTYDGPSSGSIKALVSDKTFQVKSTWIIDENDSSGDYISDGTIIMKGINEFEETHQSDKQIFIRVWGEHLVKK